MTLRLARVLAMRGSVMEAANAEERVVPMRLQRFLARAGVASRRGAENLMTAGRVRVNGEVVRELGSRVDPRVDVVSVDGHEVALGEEPVYLMLHKPAGYLCTMRDPRGRRTVAELVPLDEYPGLFCVGRLDKDTTGLLLFTTDGTTAQRLLHPSYEKEKRYVALLDGVLSRQAKRALEGGVELDDGPAAPARVRVLGAAEARGIPFAVHEAPKGAEAVELTIHEGRKHQVKRMFKAVGREVLALHREALGPLELSNLPEGKWRELTPDEVASLRAL